MMYELVISAPIPYLSHISRGSIVRMFGLITGSSVGVSNIPCLVCSLPNRALPSRLVISNKPSSPSLQGIGFGLGSSDHTGMVPAAVNMI